MHKSGIVFFNAFIRNLPSATQGVIYSHVTKKMQEHLSHVDILPYKNPLQELTPISRYLDNIHVSWITAYLRTLTENDIRLFLACLSESKKEETKRSLRFASHLPILKNETKQFLQDKLFTKIKAGRKHLLPVECLPAHPLNTLMELNTDQLMELIDLAGLTDVAQDLKHVIETAKIKQIHAALSPPHLSYLMSLIHKPLGLAFKRMGLEKWDGNVTQLLTLIHQRGLNRLAKALFGADDNLFWYINHKLDASQASALQQLHTDLNHPKGHALLIQEILDLSTHIQGRQL